MKLDLIHKLYADNIIGVSLAIFGVFVSATFFMMYSGERILSHDGYYYYQYVKLFAEQFPNNLGSLYPVGYPFIASIFVRLGVPPYFASVGLSLFSFCLMIFLFVKMTRPEKIIALLPYILIIASCRVIYVHNFSVMSELTFSATIMLIIFCMAYWDRKLPIALTVTFAIITVLIRYAGAFMIFPLMVWFFVKFSELKKAKNLSFIILSGFIAAIFYSTLLIHNKFVTGHFSGGIRPPSEQGFVRNILEFGLSPVSMISSSLSAWIVSMPILLMLIGLTTITSIMIILFLAYRQNKTKWTRPIVFVSLAYIITLCLFRSWSSFEDISTARFFIPILFPLMILIYDLIPEHFRKLVWAPSIIIFSVNFLVAQRGISPQIFPPVTELIEELDKNVQTNDDIVVTDRGSRLAAYFQKNNVKWIVEYEFEEALNNNVPSEYFKDYEYIVVVHQPSSRSSKEAKPLDLHKNIILSLIDSGEWTTLHDAEQGIILKNHANQKQ